MIDTAASNQSQPDASLPIRVAAHWEKPLIAAEGGEATLLIRIVSAPEEPVARRAPLDVAFVLDRSGSMRSGKLSLAKEGVSLAASRLADEDRAALVIYDDTVDVLQPLDAATSRFKAALRLALHGVDAGGSTFLSGGWVAGCQSLAMAPTVTGNGDEPRIRRVILLTDGLANVGLIDPGELARHAGEIRQRGIGTTTVGVGEDFDEGLLSAMAEAGGGNFRYVANPDELREFFSEELQELFTVQATGFTLGFTCPHGARAELVSAFPVTRTGKCFEVAIGDVAARDEIDLVFTVRVKPGAIDTSAPFEMTATWTDPRQDQRHHMSIAIDPLHRAARSDVVKASANPLVQERSALQKAAAERRIALDLDRQGRHRESRLRMAQAQDFLIAAPWSDDVAFDLQESRAMASVADDMAYSQHERKAAQQREYHRRRGRLQQEGDRTRGVGDR